MSQPDSTLEPERSNGRCNFPRRNNPPCKRPAGDRTDHHGYGNCWIHGGNSPNGKKSAARAKVAELVEERRRLMVFYRVEMPEITPEEVLLEEVQRSSAIVRWLEEMIDQWRIHSADRLDDDFDEDDESALELVASSVRTGLPKMGTVVFHSKGAILAPTEVNAWLRQYGEERDRAIKAAKTAIDAGIAERIVRMAEREVDTIVAVLRASLQELGVPVSPEVTQVVARQLRAVEGRVVGG